MYKLGVYKILDSGQIVVTNYGDSEIPDSCNINYIAIYKNEGEEINSPSKIVKGQNIDLRIGSIEIYRKPTSIIPKGWSAAITLIGCDLQLVKGYLESVGKSETVVLSAS